MDKTKNKPKSDNSKLDSLSLEHMRVICTDRFSKVINDIKNHYQSDRRNKVRYICYVIDGIVNKDLRSKSQDTSRGFNGRVVTFEYRMEKIIKSLFLENDIHSLRDLCSITKNIGYNYISISKDGEYITYIPYNKKYKLDWISGNSSLKNKKKQKVKIGKFVKSIFSNLNLKPLSNTEIEKFVSMFKSYSTIGGEFKEVNGEEIKLTFEHQKLVRSSTLGRSCMNGKISSMFYLYSKNPEKISMLTFKNGNLIKGRALLWKLDNGGTYMDRIYYSDEHIKHKFEEYGIRKGYSLYRDRGYEPIKVTLKNYTFDKYPYLDTVQFFSILSGVFTDDLQILEEEKIPKKTFSKLYSKVFNRKEYKRLKSIEKSYIKKSRSTGGFVIDM